MMSVFNRKTTKAKMAATLLFSCALIGSGTAYAYSSVSPPVNPLPNLYELNNGGSSSDFNLDVPPPINPEPRRTSQTVFTTSMKPSVSSSASTTTKKSSVTKTSSVSTSRTQ